MDDSVSVKKRVNSFNNQLADILDVLNDTDPQMINADQVNAIFAKKRLTKINFRTKTLFTSSSNPNSPNRFLQKALTVTPNESHSKLSFILLFNIFL